jgi:hypothetical protein
MYGLWIDCGKYVSAYAHGTPGATPAYGEFYPQPDRRIKLDDVTVLTTFGKQVDLLIRTHKPTHLGCEAPFNSMAGKRWKPVEGAKACPTCRHVPQIEEKWTSKHAEILKEMHAVLKFLAGARNVMFCEYARSTILTNFCGKGNGRLPSEEGKIAMQNQCHLLGLVPKTIQEHYDITDSVGGHWVMCAFKGHSVQDIRQGKIYA